MATGTIILWPGPLTNPDGTTNNGFSRSQRAKSSGTPPTNGTNLFLDELLWSDTQDDHALFVFPMPPDYASGGTVYIQWKRASGTGAADVVLKSSVAALTAGAGEVPNTKVMAAVSTVTTAAGTTSQALVQSTMTPNMDSAAARDLVAIMVGRDRDNAADTLTGVDVQVTAVWLEYTTA